MQKYDVERRSWRLPYASRRPLSALFSAMVLGAVLGGPVSAAPKQLDIPAQALDRALTALSEQTGVQILYSADLVRGKLSTAVSGNMEVEAALETLLRGAGVTYRIENNTVLLTGGAGESSVLDLGTTFVSGQGMGEATENSGSYTTGLTSVGSKTPTSLKETPQSVSVISSQLIEDRRMTTLSDAMKMTPGITVKNGTYRLPKLASRGFGIDNVQIDGAAPMDIGSGVGTFYGNKLYNLAEYDHIEVLRGSSGLLGGTGDPGGIINLVRKRPLDQYQLKFNASAGSWDNYRTEADITGPLGFDGKLRGRAVVSYEDRQYFMDNRSTEEPFFYGVLEADLTPDTMVTVGASYARTHENGTGDGLPRYSRGGDLHLPRHTWYTTGQAYMDGHDEEVFFKIDHYLSEFWKLNTSYTYTYNKSDTEGIIPYGSVDETTNIGPYWWGSYVSSWSKQSVFDTNLSGTFDAFGRQHELLVGADYQKVTSRWRAADGMLGKGGYIDLWNPGASPLPTNATDHDYWRDYSPNTREQYGVYSTVRLQLTDPLKLVLGARAQRYKYEQDYQTKTAGVWSYQSKIRYREPTKLVPFGGLIYALDDEWSAYVSYAEIFKPQAQKLKGPVGSSSAVEPMTGKTYEMGLKGELFDGRLNLSGALFYTKRHNEAMTDPSYPQAPFSYSGSCCFIGQGKVISKGIDLEATGEITPGWEVIAGYTLNITDNQTEASDYTSITPRHLAKLWTVYTLPGQFEKWRVGGGVEVQSANYVSGFAYDFDSIGNPINRTPYDFTQGGYAVYGAMVEYKVDDNWTVAVNGNNLFDRRYYETVGTSEYGNYYGAPRNFMLTLRGEFF
ncbi:TonB-dependent siderophore receptor [Pseudomonas sp. USHLN015]|uniref:TonB-dependent siderophore receptor n=1 Tax=Pseudomonas sp. USHLN015 TaxID=3081296 RepID=UPI00301B9216